MASSPSANSQPKPDPVDTNDAGVACLLDPDFGQRYMQQVHRNMEARMVYEHVKLISGLFDFVRAQSATQPDQCSGQGKQ